MILAKIIDLVLGIAWDQRPKVNIFLSKVAIYG
jgi:hypothetical protein